MEIKTVAFNNVDPMAELSSDGVDVFEKVMLRHGYYLTTKNIIPFIGYPKKLAIKMILRKWEGDKSKIIDEFIDVLYTDFELELLKA